MGVHDKWWFAEASLEGPPSREDGDGDMLRWPLLPRNLPWKLLPWTLPRKDGRDTFPRKLRKFERQIPQKQPKAGSCFRVNFNVLPWKCRELPRKLPWK